MVGEGSLASRLLPSQSAALDAKLAAVKKIAAERAAAAPARSVAMTAEDAPEGVVPDFAGLSIRGALRVAEPRRLELDVKGTGRALRQEPEAGTKAEPGAKVTIWFEGRDA
jgi:hypothetical protein